MSVIMRHRKHMSSSVPVHVTRHTILNSISNYHLDVVKHPENVYAVHLSIDSHNLYGYCTGYLSLPLDTFCECGNSQSEVAKVWSCYYF